MLKALVEGNAIRSAVRMTGAAKNTVVKLLCSAHFANGRIDPPVLIELR